MRARAYSARLDEGGRVVSLDACVGPGSPGLTLSHGASHEGVEGLALRLRVGLARCGHVLPPRARRVVLGPAGASPGIDLAALCALLASHEIIPAESLSDALLWGTLDHEGRLRPTPGTRRVAELARAAGMRRLFVSAASAPELGDAPGLSIVLVPDVATLVANLRDELALGFGESSRLTLPARPGAPDMADLRGLARVRGALEIMIAGRHGALVMAPARVSTMLIRRLAGLIPEPDETLAAERLALGRVGADPRAFVQRHDQSEGWRGVCGRRGRRRQDRPALAHRLRRRPHTRARGRAGRRRLPIHARWPRAHRARRGRRLGRLADGRRSRHAREQRISTNTLRWLPTSFDTIEGDPLVLYARTDAKHFGVWLARLETP